MATDVSTKAHKPKVLASTFIKQYYTMLNKAPNFIHHFYNDDSTFIYGPVEKGPSTQPAVGREQIEKKVKELELNDCRAKIEQIDSLETISGGVVIQLIGGLSNNGEPMRRFLQTFVLAPCQSSQASRQDGDQLSADDSSIEPDSNSVSRPSLPRFYVVNSIFRYHDDVPDSESEDGTTNVHANTSTDNANATATKIVSNNQRVEINDTKQQPTATVNSRQPQNPQNHQQQSLYQSQQPGLLSSNNTDSNPKQLPPQQQPQQAQKHLQHQQQQPNQPQQQSQYLSHQQQQNQHLAIDKLAHNKHPQQASTDIADHKRSDNGLRTGQAHGLGNNITSNMNFGKKTEVPERITSENAKLPGSEQIRGQPLSSESNVSAQPACNSSAPTSVPATTPRTNEHKTWANVISWTPPTNPPQSLTAFPSNAAKKVPSEQQHSQVSNAQASPQVPHQHHHQADQSPNQQLQQSHQLPPMQNMQNMQNDANQRVQNNNRRRNMIRKPSNKPAGPRGMKDRPRPPPPASKPVT